jgi:peptidoglycan/LPS O-acetylase OafA/YrhL
MKIRRLLPIIALVMLLAAAVAAAAQESPGAPFDQALLKGLTYRNLGHP